MPSYDLKVKTPATIQPVDLTKAKTNLRIELSETFWDDDINDLLEEALEEVCEQSDRTFGQTQYTLLLSRFPSNRSPEIYLPRPPLVSVDAIRYIDVSGAAATIDSADYRIVDEDASILLPASGKCWPGTHRVQRGLVEIDYTSGHSCRSKIPKQVRRAILILINQRFKNREDPKIPKAVERLIGQLRPGDELHRPIQAR